MTTDVRFMEFYYRLRNIVNSNIKFPVRYIKSPEYRKILNANKRFKDIHRGERCFILGNGPSIKEENLAVLRDEYVFVVNQATRLPFIKEINPNYYICIDSAFFNINENNPGDMEMLDAFKRLGELSPDMECFFPIEEKSHYIEKYGLDKTLHVNYFQRGLSFHEGYKKAIDYSRTTIGFGTVVQNAITLAIYMGFSEIYILGCDNTGIIVNIKSVLETVSDSEYAYHVTENEKKRMKAQVQGDLENYCRAYWYTLKDYRLLSAYCRRLGRKLVNLSAQTVIETVDRERLSKII